MDAKKQVEAIEKDIKEYSKLQRINKSAEFNDYVEMVLDMTAKKLFDAFMPGTIKSWDEFVERRAEISALLLPVQEVRSADAMVEKLRAHLGTYYAKQT